MHFRAATTETCCWASTQPTETPLCLVPAGLNKNRNPRVRAQFDAAVCTFGPRRHSSSTQITPGAVVWVRFQSSARYFLDRFNSNCRPPNLTLDCMGVPLLDLATHTDECWSRLHRPAFAILVNSCLRSVAFVKCRARLCFCVQLGDISSSVPGI